MDYKTTCTVPETELNNFKNDACQLLVITLDELLNVHRELITNPHRIGYYHLTFVMEGKGNLWIDSSKYKFESKTVFAASKGQIQAMEYDKNTKGFALLFTEEFINKYPQDIGWINNLLLFDHSLPSPLVFLPDTEYLELLIILSKIRAEIRIDGAFAKEEILANLLKTFILIAERLKRTTLNKKIPCEGEWYYLTEFKKKLEEHYSSSRSVQYYADLLSVTNRKLNQITIDSYGKPAKQVIEDRVLLEIKRLLVHTESTIKEIGHTLGFNDPTNFIKFFKKYAKVTPAEFRISYKKNQLYYK